MAASRTDREPAVELEIGLYGSRATGELAALWQGWINSYWADAITANVVAHPALESPRQVPEPNRVEVLEPGERSYATAWAADADELTIAEEAGRLPR